ncbi:MAG: redox-sensing transcriptional repressor Rex [bacterium]
MSDKRKIAEAAIARLSTYNRALDELDREGVEIISSDELGERSGYSAAQIRKDLSCFGEFGKAGRGYYVKELKEVISQILGVDRTWNVALVGAGNLGSALLAYLGFRERGFKIVAVFDNDLRKIGKRWENVVLQDISEMPEKIKEQDIQIGIIAVPAEVAQRVADMLVFSGIRAILNFAPTRIVVPDHVRLRTADLSRELECLSYFLTSEAVFGTEALEKRRVGNDEEDEVTESDHYR